MAKEVAPDSANPDGLKIRCAYTALKDIVSLQPHPRNPNRHPEDQLRVFAKILKHQGIRRPVVVSGRSGFVIKGHGLLEAARLAGYQALPVDVQDYDNEAQELHDMVADNELAKWSEPDSSEMVMLLQEAKDAGTDLELLAVTDEEFDKLAGNGDDDENGADERDGSLVPNFEVVVECSDEDEQRKAFDALTEQGYKCRVLTL